MDFQKENAGIIALTIITIVCAAGAVLLFYYPTVPEVTLIFAVVFAIGAIIGFLGLISKVFKLKPKQ
jgi:hypothetical protein